MRVRFLFILYIEGLKLVITDQQHTKSYVDGQHIALICDPRILTRLVTATHLLLVPRDILCPEILNIRLTATAFDPPPGLYRSPPVIVFYLFPTQILCTLVGLVNGGKVCITV